MLGSDDAIVSTASLMIGVAAATATRGAMAMAVTAAIGRLLGVSVG